jgi:hypothetical protein
MNQVPEIFVLNDFLSDRELYKHLFEETDGLDFCNSHAESSTRFESFLNLERSLLLGNTNNSSTSEVQVVTSSQKFSL